MTSRTGRLALLLGTTLALVACRATSPEASSTPSASAPEADYSITLTGQGGLVRTVGIDDPDDLLASGPTPIVPPTDSGGYRVEAVPANPRAVDVTWEGGCPVGLILTVDQTGTELLFDLFPGHAPPSCPAAGELFGMRLTFKESTEGLDLVTHLQPLVLESEAPA